MNKKALALIIAGLVILVAIIYFIFIYDFSKTDEQPLETTSTEQSAPAETVVSKSSPVMQATETRSAADQSRDNATQLAIFFTERYGSSSSQADFSNLIDAQVFMTEAFRNQTNALVVSERNKAQAQTYQSVITKAVVVDFATYNEATGVAEGSVQTKRLETDMEGKTKSYDQTLTISLKKVGSDWQVDGADWK